MIKNYQAVLFKQTQYGKKGKQYSFLKEHTPSFINTEQQIAYYTNLYGVLSNINCVRLSASKANAEEVILFDVYACNVLAERGSMASQEYNYKAHEKLIIVSKMMKSKLLWRYIVVLKLLVVIWCCRSSFQSYCCTQIFVLFYFRRRSVSLPLIMTVLVISKKGSLI